MKKLLLGLLLISSVLSFGATQRVNIEKLVTNENRDTLYLEETKKPYSGEVERKYPDGKLLGIATVKDGKFNGKSYEYYENGKLKIEENYVNSKSEGVSKSFYPNGKVESEVQFKNNKKEGVAKLYSENGILTSEIPFKMML